MDIRSIYFSPVAHPYIRHILLHIQRVRPISSPCWERPTGWQLISGSWFLPAPVYIASYLILFLFLYLDEYKF
jgi:hypothetical protein